MSKIQLILFDIGGVIIRWKDDWLFQDVAQKFGLHYLLLKKEGMAILPEFRRGEITEQKFWEKIGQKIGSDELSSYEKSLIHEIFKKRITIDDSVLSLIKQIKLAGNKLGILTNTSEITHSIVEETIDLSDFDYYFLSFQIGFEKPDKRIFDYVLDNTTYAKEEILLIDDKESNVTSANEFGIKAIKFSNVTQLIRDLTNFKIL